MPQIKEYGAPETEGQNPLGGVSPDVRGAGSYGEGLAAIGEGVQNVGEVLQKAEDQEQTSRAIAESTRAGVLYQQRVKEMAREGHIDTEKLREEYSDHMADVRNGFTSRYAAEAFDRQAERIGGRIMSMAAKEKLAISRRQGQSDYLEARNNLGTMVRDDQASFNDAHQSIPEIVDSYIKSGALPAEYRGKATEDLEGYLAQETLKGVAEKGQDQPPGQKGIDMAQKAFDEDQFGAFLNTKQKDGLKKWLRTERAAQHTQENLAKKAVEDARKAQVEVDAQGFLEDMLNNRFNVKKLRDNPDMTPDEKYKWLLRAQHTAKVETITDKVEERKVMNDIVDGKVTSVNELVSNPKLSNATVKRLSGWMMGKSNPENAELQESRKGVVKIIDGWTTKGINALDPGEAAAKRSEAIADLQAAEDSMRKQGKPLRGLYDRGSTDFWANDARKAKYHVDIVHLMQKNADGQRTAPLNIPPRTEPIPGEAPAKNEAPKGPATIQPGESGADFLKRIGK